MAAASSLALSCRSLCSLLGSIYWSALQTNQKDRNSFLALLERDLPSLVLCYHCKKLHGTNAPPNSSCAEADRHAFVHSFLHYGFRFTTFQLAMKCYRLDLDHDSQLGLISFTNAYYYHEHTYLYSNEARIIPGNLSFRTQLWYMLPPADTLSIPTSLWSIDLCPHLIYKNLRTIRTRGRLLETLKCRFSHWQNHQLCTNCSGLTKCQKCPTEFQVDIKEFQGYGVAVVITRWLDLGQGFPPLDLKSRSHLRINFEDRPCLEPVLFETGTIRAQFEGGFEDGRKFSFDSVLTPREKANLLERPWYV